MANPETIIQNRIRLALTARFHPHGVFWRQNAGGALTQRGTHIPLGPTGIADLVGMLVGMGAFIEVKTDTGKQSKQQKTFQRAIEKAGGLYIIARSPEEAIAGLTAGLEARGLAVPPPPELSPRRAPRSVRPAAH